MFNILITLIVIVLVGAMALITTYFMGDRLTDSQSQAQATGVINAASQISDATKLYKVHHFGSAPANIDDLIESGYLRTKPDAIWEFGNETLENPGLDKGLCEEVNDALHQDTSIPSCNEVSQSFTGCCSK